MSNSVDHRNSTLGNASVRRAQRKLPKLSEEQILEFKEAFKLFDTDNGGSIDVDELKDALESLGQVVTEGTRACSVLHDCSQLPSLFSFFFSFFVRSFFFNLSSLFIH
jgi:hypothetical protein